MPAARAELPLSERSDTRVEGLPRVYASRSASAERARGYASRSVACAVVVALSACAANTPPVRPPVQTSVPALEFLGEFIVEPVGAGHRLQTTRFGGVSGVVLDPLTGELLGVCDEDSPNRVFVFRIDVAARPFRVDLTRLLPLAGRGGHPHRFDPEGVATTRDGRLFVASEGSGRIEPRQPPAIVEFTRRADYAGRLAGTGEVHSSRHGTA